MHFLVWHISIAASALSPFSLALLLSLAQQGSGRFLESRAFDNCPRCSIAPEHTVVALTSPLLPQTNDSGARPLVAGRWRRPSAACPSVPTASPGTPVKTGTGGPRPPGATRRGSGPTVMFGPPLPLSPFLCTAAYSPKKNPGTDPQLPLRHCLTPPSSPSLHTFVVKRKACATLSLVVVYSARKSHGLRCPSLIGIPRNR